MVPKRLLEEGLYGFEDDISSNTVEVMMSRLRKRLTARFRKEDAEGKGAKDKEKKGVA